MLIIILAAAIMIAAAFAYYVGYIGFWVAVIVFAIVGIATMIEKIVEKCKES